MSLIYIQPAAEADLAEIMAIMQDAKAFLKSSGSSQWQNGYPDTAAIKNDLVHSAGWLLKVNGETAGYLAAITDGEPTYKAITGGSWQNDQDPYVTIHRLAVKSRYRGQHLTSYFFASIISLMLQEGFHNFRIDTSPVNQPMQQAALSQGFKLRGHILVATDPDSPDRLAYELNL
ncbi:GNAT family N-acetyltransferase [Lactobacillus corticis]|uniref:GNAT family acetyltransferase n=1 Tax=Lactobacillus corticis TaxID=2201249 RepID=A0A916QKX7_9LACO|nr:GNAT family N-acetyltransferase [Lactobacillus corticis]GFZ27580.1 GNAT family acetyltransferase [Lactobacillus corticis]